MALKFWRKRSSNSSPDNDALASAEHLVGTDDFRQAIKALMEANLRHTDTYQLCPVRLEWLGCAWFKKTRKGFILIFFGKLLFILAITLVLSSLFYHFIEKPFLKIKDRL